MPFCSRTKKVAPRARLEWRDDDAGVLSQGWLVDARTSEEESITLAARRRLLQYNEDDVAASAATIRDGLRLGHPAETSDGKQSRR